MDSNHEEVGNGFHTFFEELPNGNKYNPRAVFVDLDPTTID